MPALSRKKKTPKGGERNLESKPRSVRDLVRDAREWFLQDDGWDFLKDIDFSAVPEYGGDGRRSGYHPAFCLVAVFLGFQGFHKYEIAARLKQARQTLTNWGVQNPEFLAAMACAKELSEAWTVSVMRQTASGKLPGNVTALKFMLKNLNPDSWKDKHEFEGRTEVVKDVKDLSPEEVATMDSDRKRRLVAALDAEESGGEVDE